ncbi:MAG: glycosyltransferase family 2 protein [Dokdonella sp.]
MSATHPESPSRVDALTSIIVVAADSGPLLQACIDSSLASNAPFELILVDNASTDGEVERAATRHAQDPRLRILRNQANIGFGPACNRGAVLAQGSVLVFLNPDCELRADTVAALHRAVLDDARIGVLGVTVCNADGSPARGNRRRDPSFRRALASMTGLSRWERRWPSFAGVEMPAAGSTGGVEFIEAVSGACMAMPRTAYESVGGFDEGYFLHVEDLDLCRRVRAAGFQVAIAHALQVLHVQGSSSRKRPLFVARHKHRGMWRYFRHFDPAARNPLLRSAVWMGLWLHFLVKVPMLGWRWLANRLR